MPKVWEQVLVRHIKYNNVIELINDREEKGISLVIRPPKKLKVKSAENNPKKLQKAYDLGRSEALKRLDEIKEFLNIK